MKSARVRNRRQSGFSLIELLVVVAILMVISGSVMQTISDVQKRARTEETRLDEFQTAREFMDQMIRDVHQTGFPNLKMYEPNVMGAAFQQDVRNAVGLVDISPTNIHFEGDVDGDGVVDEVFYTLVPQSAAAGLQNCPCIRRSVAPKAPGVDPTAQAPNYSTQVENVVAPPGTTIFSYYDNTGNLSPSQTMTRANWSPLAPCSTEPINCVWSVQIRLNVQSANTDLGTGTRLQAVLTSGAQINN